MAADEGPLSKFFAEFPCFSYDSDEPATSEFYRLADSLGWHRLHPDREDAHNRFKIALTRQFNGKYGTEVESLESWQMLCGQLGVNPIPDTLKKCRQIVLVTHVNLVDLVGAPSQVKIFDTVEELSLYTRSTGKFFPMMDAFAGDLLRYLLRHILDPSKDSKHGASGHGNRGRGRKGRRGRGRGR